MRITNLTTFFTTALLGGAGVLGLGAFGALTTAAIAALGRQDTARGALLMAALYGAGAGALAEAGVHRLSRVTPEAVNFMAKHGRGAVAGVASAHACNEDLAVLKKLLDGLGAPGCVANVDVNAGVGFVISNLGAPLPGLTVPLSIPAGPPAIIGQSFYCQSAWLDATQNALGMITSNALRLIIG